MKRLVLFAIVLLLAALPVVAADSGYSIEAFSTDITVSDDGIYRIDEHIAMHFSKALHGFYRVIPVEYRFNDPSRQDVRVRVSAFKANESFSTSREGEYLVVKVGDPDRVVTGNRAYDLSYTYNIGNDGNSGYDEFYLNLVGEDWQVPIKQFSFSIRFPSAVQSGSIWFTKGLYGSQSSRGVQWQLSADGMTLSGKTTEVLYPGEAVTVRIQMPDGYFAMQDDRQAAIALFNWIFSLAAVALAVFLWIRFGRDDELIVVPQFSAAQGMTPMDMGYIVDETLDPRDITSMIFYWADKGCLSIVEDDGKFSFVRGRDPKGGPPHELKLFNAFFRNAANGVVKTSDLQGKFFSEYQKMATLVGSYYRGERALASMASRNMAVVAGLLTLVPAIAYALAITANLIGPITLVSIVACLAFGAVFAVMVHLMMRIWHIRKGISKVLWFVLLGLVVVFGAVILTIPGLIGWNDFDFSFIEALKAVVPTAIIAFFAVNTRKRSEYGKKSVEAVLGYRDFIDKVEIEKLKRMIDDDPEFYYHVLSYAIVLGLEKKWAKKFDGITLEPPQWYMGRYDMWNAMVLSSMLSRCNTALVSSIATMPKTSPGVRFGGSSFGGGGFSGGGFGGGGGGAW